MDTIGNVLSFSLYEGLVFGFVAIGIYLTFRVLGFPDLTVDGSFTLGAAITGVLIVIGVNPFLATLAAFGVGLCAGLATSLLNTKLRIPALLAGILMMVALYSINLRVMGGANVSLLREVTIFDQVFEWLGLGADVWYAELILAGALVVIVFLILNWFLRTEIGLALRATGDNEQMVRGLGADTDMTTILGVSISNGLVALAGAVVAQGQGFADVGMGIGMIVMGLASVIIGEALFRPRGVARLLLAVIGGTFVYRLMITIALRLGMAPGDLKLITALLVIIALAIPYIQKKVRRQWLPPAAKW
ncbi:MAG TPA: ABC transporter permease [Dehalococcoidia bacterium]|nr:ABC transporter permease [Dehalococcoidia bacterium]